jgi:hypothetical protein
MAKALFKSYDYGEILMFPTSLEDKIPKDAPVRVVSKRREFRQ